MMLYIGSHGIAVYVNIQCCLERKTYASEICSELRAVSYPSSVLLFCDKYLS